MSLSRDDIKKIMPDITDEQLSAVLAAHHAEVTAKSKSYDEKIKALSEKADLYDKEQQEKLSEKEKLDNLLAEAARLKAENSRMLNRTKAQAKFVEAGIKEDVYTPLLDNLVSDSEETTLAFTENLIKAISTSSAAAAAAAKQEAMQTPPPAPGVVPLTDAAAAQDSYNKAVNGGSVLDIIQATDALLAAQTKTGG